MGHLLVGKRRILAYSLVHIELQDRQLKFSASVWKRILTHSAHSDNFCFYFLYPLSDWFELLWASTKFFFKQMRKISAVYLEKQKSFIPKKIFSKPRVNRFQYQNNQLCLLTQFSVKVLVQMGAEKNLFCAEEKFFKAW